MNQEAGAKRSVKSNTAEKNVEVSKMFRESLIDDTSKNKKMNQGVTRKRQLAPNWGALK